MLQETAVRQFFSRIEFRPRIGRENVGLTAFHVSDAEILCQWRMVGMEGSVAISIHCVATDRPDNHLVVGNLVSDQVTQGLKRYFSNMEWIAWSLKQLLLDSPGFRGRKQL